MLVNFPTPAPRLVNPNGEDDTLLPEGPKFGEADDDEERRRRALLARAAGEPNEVVEDEDGEAYAKRRWDSAKTGTG